MKRAMMFLSLCVLAGCGETDVAWIAPAFCVAVTCITVAAPAIWDRAGRLER